LDSQENKIYLNKIQMLIKNNHNEMVRVLTPVQPPPLSQEIRHFGNSIVTLAEELTKTERRFMNDSLLIRLLTGK